MINISSPRCHSTIKGLRGGPNCQDVNRYRFWRDKIQTCPPSSSPSSSLKVKANKLSHPTMPIYGGDIYSDDIKCDDQQDHL